ncbi:UDP-N-acetylmuramoyl-L-alanyl-D-glutamate--2,6-diaminopimelate ligase [Anaerolinea thermophila]|uniref:UDP-N-acetylmuramyl-tripeptide synthetase n=1 Tax=Anaerolinea thermophila (strain DSM 14523 / JCM 11388 / NBRC 100420 / UNI-1) TaxID=926569 RepID=E8N3S5_ANATU|nr:UDP-N-acetylmuramoyl-L-alanyl-D-glutamate--2,6-diaminopimelate ligase [Anaerolinea thermophila]BAJ63089.1 UDP-N-acetylmuramoylalanyl-D-glutamate--2,6-diaminopimelate ligase [Anaerolinea thermophila UNI-1]
MIGFVRRTLPELIRHLPIQVFWEGTLPDVPVTGITYNHRDAQPGYIFVAFPGTRVDGHTFIPHAIERGIVAVVGMQEISGLSIPYLRVSNSREALAYLSAAFYNFPAHEMTVIGVTGTDGKTTTSNLIYQILLAAGHSAGIVSTVNAVIGDEVVDTGFHVTTPEAPEVQRYLSRMRAAGLTHVVLEATSHGLEQHRVTGCEFDVGVVTNITHEHLDYHGSYEAYRAAKGRLFTMLSETPEKPHGNPRLAVLNRDDQSYEYLQSLVRVPAVSYGLAEGADLRAENIRYEADRLRFDIVGRDFRQPVETCLVGEYNVSNCLAAFAATVLGLGIDSQHAAQGIANMSGVPGRMERIHMGQSFHAIVDFAHTPNALKQALLTARQITRGRVIAVFGSAGLRDREKRRLMAEVSAQLADISIFTAEDPRTESLEGILEEMARGAESQGAVRGKQFYLVPDRGDAIRMAVQMAKPDDLVIACGKGHEQSMCFGETEYPWDDRVAMRAALAELLGVPGPAMPYLPTRER